MEIKENMISTPTDIQLDITNKCNFRCAHCYNESGENYVCKNELTDDEIELLFEDLEKIKPFNVCFCGGEPLLRYEIISKVGKKVKGIIPNLSIVTNGYLLTETVLQGLLDAGINRIQISLDGTTKETYERLRLVDGSFDHAVNALELCLRYRDRMRELMISYIPTSFNTFQFRELAESWLSKGVDCIRVQPLMLSGRGRENAEDINPKLHQYAQLVKTIFRLQSKYDSNKISYGDPIDHIIRFSKYLTKANTNITIKANGNIVLTPYIPISFGNIKDKSLSEYCNDGLLFAWAHPKVQEYSSHMRVVEDIGKDVAGFPRLWQDDDLFVNLNKGEAV